MSRGQIELCAPERIDSPMTSASSCIAAATICSGVCRSPDASRAKDALAAIESAIGAGAKAAE